MLKEFFSQYGFIILSVITILLFIVFQWQRFKAISFALMLQAKRLAKEAVLNSGAEQEDWVVSKAYQFLPKSITVFISREAMKTIVHYLYTEAKDYLDDGELNGSIKS